ncbi:3-hydroxyacyl-ACP dehydratase FabZ family protein [Salinimicrobium soli]|uniref:3-hydroxyacyl-ACP dehydratase FabZ family protein n=1 Tax=Salinimicrobium soli TaxID=1254399 RepID=UPI003AAFF5E8
MATELPRMHQEIIDQLPYESPFLFVDELEEVHDNGVTGTFTFSPDQFFYKGHFRDKPVTPGVILTECMAQIGLVSLGIYLLRAEESEERQVALSHTDVHFYLPVFPGEKVWVTSEKKYFRFQKLKCKVEMKNAAGKLVGRGEISGMIRNYE